jgi:hypothetical protein
VLCCAVRCCAVLCGTGTVAGVVEVDGPSGQQHAGRIFPKAGNQINEAAHSRTPNLPVATLASNYQVQDVHISPGSEAGPS